MTGVRARVLVSVAVCLVLGARAEAARVWSGPVAYGPVGASGRAVAVGPDDTRVTTWTVPSRARPGVIAEPYDVFVAAGDHDPVMLGQSYIQDPYVAAARGHSIVAWTDWATRQADVALPNPDGTMTSVALPGTFVSGVAINDAGEAAVAAGSGVFVRPPGGDFGPSMGTGGAPLLVAPTGEVVYTGYANGGLEIDSTLIAPFALPAGAKNLALGADANGHVVAAWADIQAGVVNIAIRAPDGTWGAPVSAGVSLADVVSPAVAVNARGDAVVALPSRAGVAYVVTGNLADGALSAPVALADDGAAFVLSAAIGADGSAVVMAGDQTVALARRDGLGPFGPFETIDCYSGTENRALAIDDAGHAVVADNAGLLFDSPSDTAAPRTCDPVTFFPVPSYSEKHVLAGEPVRVDAAGLHAHDADVTAATFHFDDGGRTRPAGATAVFHTFPRPGRVTWQAKTTQHPRFGTPTQTTQLYPELVDVYSRATLTAPGVEPRADVRAHGLRVRANAEASRVAAPVTITVRDGSRVLAHLRALLDARPRALRLRLAHVPRQVTVQLAQGGRVRVTRRVALR